MFSKQLNYCNCAIVHVTDSQLSQNAGIGYLGQNTKHWVFVFRVKKLR